MADLRAAVERLADQASNTAGDAEGVRRVHEDRALLLGALAEHPANAPVQEHEHVCDCGHAMHLHDREAVPPLCMACGDDKLCGTYNLMMLAIHGHPDDLETALERDRDQWRDAGRAMAAHVRRAEAEVAALRKQVEAVRVGAERAARKGYSLDPHDVLAALEAAAGDPS